MYSARDDTALPVPGFPIRVSAGQSLFSSSPRLIAAVHALLRLLMPRHPPCALTILTVIVDKSAPKRRRTTVIFRCCLANYAVFKVRRGRSRGDSPAGLSKLSSAPRAIWRVWPAQRRMCAKQRASPLRGDAFTPDLQARSTFRDAVWPKAVTTGSSLTSSLERR